MQLFTFNGVFMSALSTQITIELWSVLKKPALVSVGINFIKVNVSISNDFTGEINSITVLVSLTVCEEIWGKM